MNTQTRSILPVEVGNSDGYDEDEIFDYRKHKSHLITCAARRMDWGREQKFILNAEAKESKIFFNQKQ